MEIAGEMEREGSRHAALAILNNAEAISKHKQLSGKCSRKLGLPFFSIRVLGRVVFTEKPSNGSFL
ncbi:hypothetical protein WN51_02190 [Melipona quadrifasciata]|uniref:Uncharacterized protein n=1 Tax=Melipona quadrifasciata TaxID=166423 RepID=A0A0M8ZVC4_9HYME|nr:hypothetical protein WN51_02190 [Melipona quadrifasciata]